MDITNVILNEMGNIKQKRKLSLTLTVNKIHYHLQVDPTDCVVDLLRDRLLLFGKKRTSESAMCEHFSVLIDGKIAEPSKLLANQVNGKSLVILEGLPASIR
ncbi:hypothetical protein CYL18_14180 [Pradoshia eiseniae]|uniref:Uncharacterized protein n=1 Tax=Pradoshia eiseniae TaxID=2064768 RepID=A0A2S7MXM6_9BACI|nr:hypothetical protein [Pradoshia eiseniae]PQD94551.1 hypothetical protein CYL18_14180 [Pradoshia eiseniae]